MLSVLVAGSGSGLGAGNNGWAIGVRGKVGITVLLMHTGKNGSNNGSVLAVGMWWVV